MLCWGKLLVLFAGRSTPFSTAGTAQVAPAYCSELPLFANGSAASVLRCREGSAAPLVTSLLFVLHHAAKAAPPFLRGSAHFIVHCTAGTSANFYTGF